jgi:hypothetical protein
MEALSPWRQTVALNPLPFPDNLRIFSVFFVSFVVKGFASDPRSSALISGKYFHLSSPIF